MKKIFYWIKNFYRKQLDKNISKISFNDQFILLEDVKNSYEIFWKEIEKISVFKRDLYVVDIICLKIFMINGKGFEINEEMKGWEKFISSLPIHLQQCQNFEEWFSSVAFPAFETNEYYIYKKSM